MSESDELLDGETDEKRASPNIALSLVSSGKLGEAHVREIETYANQNNLKFEEAALRLNLVAAEDLNTLDDPPRVNVQDDNPGAFATALQDSDSPVIEELRTIRSRLLLGWLKHAGKNVLAITSPNRNEGRSWLTASLGVLFAQAGLRTLIIDADMRRPTQQQIFGLNATTGLSQLLARPATKDVIRRIAPGLRLYLLPAGKMPSNPQELLTNRIFEAVLNRVAKQFDIVMIDTPPATESADAEIVAARAGAAILISRRNCTTTSSLYKASEGLKRSGVEVIGSVITEY